MGVETAMMIAAAAQAAGTMVEGVSAYRGAQYNAEVLKTQALQAKYDAGSEIQQTYEEGARLHARGVTVAAKQGGGYEGSAMDVLADLGRQNLYEGRRIAHQAVQFGRAARAEAKQSMAQAKIGLMSSALAATAQAAAGFAQAKAAGAPAPKSSTIMTDAMARRTAKPTARFRIDTNAYAGSAFG